MVAYRHPILDSRHHGAIDIHLLSDAEVERIVAAFGAAARLAQEIGFDFVDLKHCHGYLGHEFLSAYHRSGQYGGCFENRTRFLRELIAAVRSPAKGLEIGVRVSTYDTVPFVSHPESRQGVPVSAPAPYCWGFGVNPESRNLVRMHVVYRSVAAKELSYLHESARLYEHVTLSSSLSNRKLMRGYVLAASLIYQGQCGMTKVSRHLLGHGALNVGY